MAQTPTYSDDDRRASGEHDQPRVSLAVTQTNLISDGSVPAANMDPSLVNPWGLSFGPTSPFWLSDNGSGVTTLNNGSGLSVSAAGGHHAITIAKPAGDPTPATPTGQVFNTAGNGFTIAAGGNAASAVFIFATEDGTISGWNPSVDPANSVIAVDNSANGAVYKGLAYGTVDGSPRIYAANFSKGTVDVFDQNFSPVQSFTDPNLPPGYAPFNVQNLDGRLFVTYALQDQAKHDDVAGRGHGFVDEFDASGHLIVRVASGGPLNSPWGLDIAPPSFGPLAGDLLVGNFGDGRVDVYDIRNDMLAGVLKRADGKPLQIDGLWSLTNGNGSNAGDPNTVYFTAGPNHEQGGLFGSIVPSAAIGGAWTTPSTAGQHAY